MRLLHYNNDGEFSLTQFSHDIPRYAILSHTWGLEEVTFEDITERNKTRKTGFDKIRFCGEQARRDHLQYFWVDTCCIDKSSSAELAEAITCMFRWYCNAAKCYVYLSDVPSCDHNQADQSLQSWQCAFAESRWFTRGWTLQELIAPRSVEFFCSNGERIGDKISLERQLHEITGIAVPALRGTSLSTFSVEDRMSWAENRQTQREEDRAYSLLGIFDISMPVIYGEGAQKAFERLKEELFKRSRKHQFDELSHAFDSAKRLKIPRSQSSCVPSSRGPDFLDPSNSYDATTKQSLIDQLYFTKIDERLISLTAAQGTTCRWFLAKPEYISWHDVAQQPSHGGFLWIKGNPGTGKSTLMKLLFEKAKANAKSDPSQITLSFFFLARGTVEEKSSTGLYRSLLHQLFEMAKDLRDTVEWMTADGARVVQRNGWHGEALKQTLTYAVQKLGSRSLTIFVDALDECDKSQAADMISFFEELCDCAKEAHVRLQVCFSSRHYPTIVIQKGLEVTLEDETGHTKDIEQYIKSKLRLGKSKLKQAESLRSEILEKSSGIFLWVVLVLDILNSEYADSSISIKRIRERLNEIPPRLTDLFEMILMRDGENLERLQVCLKWILFATRPLKPPELYFAIQLSLDKECSGFWDQEDVDLEEMTTFVRSSSKGLAEATRNMAAEVQFIHESVRDFLIGKYEGQWSGGSGNLIGDGHETLRNCCLAQLNASIGKYIDIPNHLPRDSEAAQLRESIGLKFPFLEYSILNVFHHANSAQQNAIGQENFLTEIPLKRWISLNNTLERFDIRRYTASASLLYILLEKNLAELIRIHPKTDSCFDVENERYGPPIFAALATGSYDAVQTCLEVLAQTQLQGHLLHHLCEQYSESRYKWDFGRNFTFSRRRNIASYAAEQGDLLILNFFGALGKLDVKSRDRARRTPLSLAVETGYDAVVKLLLEKGAEVEAKDKNGRTPLSLAVETGYDAVVKLLLEKGAEVEAKDKNGRTPLSLAVETEYYAVVKLLLEKGANLEARDVEGQTPLMYTVYAPRHLGDFQMQLMVLEQQNKKRLMIAHQEQDNMIPGSNSHEGVRPVVSNRQPGPLWGVEDERKAIVELLLQKGAELEARDMNGRTPLSWAVEKGYMAIVKLLLETGAKQEARDMNGRTPLSWAVENRREAIVELLLEKGAELEARDMANRTPLSWAVEKGYTAIVKLLLETGAKLEARDMNDRTPLSWAMEKGDVAVIKLLLEKDANLEVKDWCGRTPLILAKQRRYEAIVELLLEKGAKPNFDF
ncbi:PFS domain-containing protein [Phlyctema vagabunda]|uniref:PFS domain-containing protein n=1 Tax=Phlyctema vagabunda TaxID=108571 RepID=A0ABR4P457_9HELO